MSRLAFSFSDGSAGSISVGSVDPVVELVVPVGSSAKESVVSLVAELDVVVSVVTVLISCLIIYGKYGIGRQNRRSNQPSSS